MNDTINYLPIVIQFVVAFGFVFSTLLLAGLVGPKTGGVVKDLNFECGVESMGNARAPFSVKFFLVAILFVIFDIEVIFMYPWAVSFKEMGWIGLVKMCFFLGSLLLGFFYVIKKGGLDWD
ncbi:MAG: NADH-quinone oxidoreductase subunit A [Chitinophagales bacterium]|nr:NADH-quinone oxidoreductase subunit A [Chitinophagales bacterium]MCZ2392261.1 NADH-quinone oxidoreductase subunit A [Chitinophagales bacterium]